MKCPIDETALQMMERQGIEIDYCPKCRGVWLDRGELDKLIEQGASKRADEGGGSDRGRGRGNEDERGGFLENIFDFM